LPAERADDPPYDEFNLTTRPVNDWLLAFGMTFIASDGDAAFPALEQMLGDAILHNDGSTARIIYDFSLGASLAPSGNVQYAPDNSINRAVNCVDRTWSQRWNLPTDVRPFVNRLQQVAPRLGEASAFQMTICFKYPIPPVEAPPLNVSLPTSVPTLVVGGTKDGSTPFVWSQRIAQRTAARLLVREGYGHVSYDKSRCAQQAMDLFLTDLALPPAGTVCQTDPDLYPPAGPILPPLE
jgi:pimeloyl-ACP methyl ester carboxylesterase